MQPAEGVGWELAFSIAAVVVGGTLLTGGVGSVTTTLAGVLLLGKLIFNVLNFENGLGWISKASQRLLAVGGAGRFSDGGRNGELQERLAAPFAQPNRLLGLSRPGRSCQRLVN